MYKKALSVVNGEVIDQKDDKTGLSPAETIADDGVYDTGIDAFTGSFNISLGDDSAVALCHVASGTQVISSVTGSSALSDTKDTDTKVNVYVEGGSIKIQNLSGDAVVVEARLF